MKIKVLQKHIRAGIRGSGRFCPIALAIKQAAGERKVTVRYLTVQLEKTRYFFPRKVSSFIARFDRGKKVKPFEFELHL